MKKIILPVLITIASLSAYGEGPVFQCKVTRQGPRSDGKPGFELIDRAEITTVIDEKFETTQLKDLDVKTYVNATDYVLVLSDKVTESSSTQMGSLENKLINLSLNGGGIANFITCKVL